MPNRRPVVRHGHVGRPHALHSLLEPRALLEMALLPASLPLLAEAPRGDGHPVLLMPGFMADEKSLIALRLFLQRKGYDVHTWGLGRNLGFRSKHASALPQKIRYLHHITGRKVSLVGWSLGGVFSLYGAQNTLECVRSIITLGSPVSVDAAGSQSPPAVRALYRLVSHRLGPAAHVMQPRAKTLREQRRLAIPTSCLYSLGDGVVPPQEATIDGDPALHENIRVPGSHLGLGFNGIVLAIVADRLAQPEGAWQPFQPKGLLARVWRATAGRGEPACLPPPDHRTAHAPTQRKRRRLHLLGQRPRQFQRHAAAHLRPVDGQGRHGALQADPAHVESRLGRLPVFRQKLLRVPLDLDYPYWVEDESFDIEYHVRHIALPKPGDWRQFCIQAARIHARPLDQQRPLWEMYVIEGLDSFLDLPVGSFAVLLKIHHSAIDVSRRNEITALLHDVSPDSPPPAPPEPWFPEDAPGNFGLLWRAGFHAATLPLRLAQPLAKSWTTLKAATSTFLGEFLGRPQEFPHDPLQQRGLAASRVRDAALSPGRVQGPARARARRHGQ
jgi:pimeloyl-ACP methyl ester carboxylesterase